MITIKKYSNRRLYDTSTSQYVTLEELAMKIKGGAKVRVIDAKTQEDLTQSVLAQIIIESRGAGKLLPTKLLVQLLRMEDDALAEFFGQYMSWALDIYLKMRQNAERFGAFNPLNNMAAPFGQPNPMMQWMSNMYGGWTGNNTPGNAPPAPMQAPPVPGSTYDAYPEEEPTPPPPAPEPAPQVAEKEGEVAALRREMDELKALIRAAAAQNQQNQSSD